MFSNWDTFAGSATNLVTDLVLGFTLQDNPRGTPIVKSWDTYIVPSFQNGWDNVDWEQIGEGFMLMMSQLVKY